MDSTVAANSLFCKLCENKCIRFDENFLACLFDIPMKNAATLMGIGINKLKTICRGFGISSWPCCEIYRERHPKYSLRDVSCLREGFLASLNREGHMDFNSAMLTVILNNVKAKAQGYSMYRGHCLPPELTLAPSTFAPPSTPPSTARFTESAELFDQHTRRGPSAGSIQDSQATHSKNIRTQNTDNTLTRTIQNTHARNTHNTHTHNTHTRNTHTRNTHTHQTHTHQTHTRNTHTRNTHTKISQITPTESPRKRAAPSPTAPSKRPKVLLDASMMAMVESRAQEELLKAMAKPDAGEIQESSAAVPSTTDSTNFWPLPIYEEFNFDLLFQESDATDENVLLLGPLPPLNELV